MDLPQGSFSAQAHSPSPIKTLEMTFFIHFRMQLMFKVAMEQPLSRERALHMAAGLFAVARLVGKG